MCNYGLIWLFNLCFPLDYKILRIFTVLELLWLFRKYLSDRRADKRINGQRAHRLYLAENLPLLEGHLQKYNLSHCGIVIYRNSMLFYSLSLEIISETQKGEVTCPGDRASQCQLSLLWPLNCVQGETLSLHSSVRQLWCADSVA